MVNNKVSALLVVVVSALISTVWVLCANSSAPETGWFSTMALCALLAFIIQWCVFIPSYLKQTEWAYDLTGSLTFVILVFVAITSQTKLSTTSILLAAMVVVWAARLGTFLFIRINKDGVDGRFDEIKPNKYRFFSAWTLQALWVLITSGAVLTVVTSEQVASMHSLTLLGFGIWLLGFVVEVIADGQKYRFKQDPENQGRFINAGLWAYSRHPNYFGEILLWIGVAVAAFPVLQGWQLVTLTSPLFVILLLTQVSGIPMVEKRADQKWGDDPSYQAYKNKTPVLIPTFTKK